MYTHRCSSSTILKGCGWIRSSGAYIMSTVEPLRSDRGRHNRIDEYQRPPWSSTNQHTPIRTGHMCFSADLSFFHVCVLPTHNIRYVVLSLPLRSLCSRASYRCCSRIVIMRTWMSKLIEIWSIFVTDGIVIIVCRWGKLFTSSFVLHSLISRLLYIRIFRVYLVFYFKIKYCEIINEWISYVIV